MVSKDQDKSVISLHYDRTGRKLTGLDRHLSPWPSSWLLLSLRKHPSLGSTGHLAFPGLLSAKADFPLLTAREPETPGSRKSQKLQTP